LVTQLVPPDPQTVLYIWQAARCLILSRNRLFLLVNDQRARPASAYVGRSLGRGGGAPAPILL
jgi:hypothetical protein